MELNILKPRKALNKAFLKVKTNRNEIELFKANLIGLLDQIDETESEEFHKNLVSDFLKNTWYGATHFINTKGRNDLVIHNALNAGSTVGVVVEAKKPTNKVEMLRTNSINTKAFQELVLYYLRERITTKNLEIKYLVATNIYEWFIFDANLFEKEFAQNKNLVKQFTDFEEGRLSGKTTDFFYKQIAEPAIEAIKHEITFTWFDIRDYDKPLRNADKKDDNILIALYKLLSPEHLLKLPFVNDSNSLDKTFYTELLHIIGLTETKEGSKKLIQRKKEGERNSASLIESAIFQLDNLDKISRLDRPSQFGETNTERLFNVALELSITWINRILFLKLLEAQLIKYHKGDQSFAFLNIGKVQNFDDLNNLFFSVLARQEADRNEEVKKQFANVPYLNSSLFEPTGIEHACLFISQLKDMKLPLLSSTVIKNNSGQKRTGELLTIEYIFEFLNAYDFASEGSEEIQEENKRLINASVLGLIFEKINGYKDGSFFTPGFITMYMCRETIRRAVVQKFNEALNSRRLQPADNGIKIDPGFSQTNYQTIDDVYNSIGQHFTKDQANDLINSLKICDPAVGSGHFLVSALNEMIAIKSELKILRDREGKTLRDYHVTVENDELIVTDDDGGLFGYNPQSRESQRIQETLFHEKQTIIENCLFGVDINPNSVKICRLRLWIELLKNAYYTQNPQSNNPINPTNPNPNLETLPNIDINIKCGNSLISRYALDADIKKALKNSKWTIDSYRLAIMTYRNAQSKEEKRAMEKLIAQIKNDFESDVAANDKRVLKLNKAKGELFALTTQTTLFDRTKVEKAIWDKQVKSLTDTILSLETELEGIRSNKIYENAFEWRFEFPEVLNEEGDFVGFDVVIGNPPYGVTLSKAEDNVLRNNYKVSNYQIDTYTVFTELGNNLLHQNGNLIFITPSAWFASTYDIKFRKYLIDNELIKAITKCPKATFEDAVVETSIIHISKMIDDNILNIYNLDKEVVNQIDKCNIRSDKDYCFYVFANSAEQTFRSRISSEFSNVNDSFDIVWGIKVYQKGKGYPPQNGSESLDKIYHSKIKVDQNYKPFIGGSDISPYLINWSDSYINYGPWIAEPRNPEWFKAIPRIVVREITAKGRIYAAFIEEESVFSNSVDGIRSKTNNINQLLQLLGVLNSKFAAYYHLSSSSNSQKDAFPKVLLQNLRDFPFEPKVDNQIVSLVSQVIEQKRDNTLADTTALESEIDRLVYQLYGLTDEEIKIVEGN
ncbi:MAG: Eco57I restriction-modification methylase domain-containing protein [Prolixibacteraceae bacterium]|nr:Eco57I restriction-modification methylase domain-containing protein [Prolixibacteraceae bacterium]